ncbi:TIGR03087 family PEP-CTERM/XrtA system glycosyltransferase [Candidatus Nitrospira neomarina]|uniref:TIGR03087 family PEP-CTERM/XrtA system glycosyltransferase n=1 Tax=Candidatus Nitrospira neomarina TaxID=3020899 RepID=A0AA96GMC9_9BACT|nr:TIGR03087 family PEP-CTERM/XrtA system glycosyltransferase [Candidatus Nitrospira neomarina]WNM63982.1 TIGR03087 family PEP-CTERM/XrtA system glycosyltransferase [Candidatus Nitrospira neomarina]
MNILFVCHRFPYPPNRGGKIRPFHMIKHLSDKHRVVVATLAETHQELEQGSEIRQYCAEVIAEVVPPSLRWVQAFGALPTRTPSSAAYFWSPRLFQRIREVSESIKFDMVLVHCAFVAPYVSELPGCFKVLDFGDIDSMKWTDYATWRAFPLNLGYALEAKKLRSFEQEMAKRFDHCLVTTTGEWKEYDNLKVPTPCGVIPNGVDTSYFSMKNGNEPIARDATIVFLGRMDYFPNVDGALFFAEEVFPIIQKELPHAQFLVVGADPAKSIRKLGELPNVTVTGTVPDVRPFLRNATLTVAPLRIARGTQNKILESIAMGLPVVATPQAARGIQAKEDEHLFVSATPEDFAHRVIQLLKNPSLRVRLANAAKKQIQKTHSWDSSMKSLDKLIETKKLDTSF